MLGLAFGCCLKTWLEVAKMNRLQELRDGKSDSGHDIFMSHKPSSLQ